MSKIPPIVNGAEDNVGYADGEEIMVRQANPVNLAAAVHDHISCTKSADLRKIPETKDGRVNLPLADHMYANYSEKPKGLGMITTVSPIPSEIQNHVRCLEEIVLSQLTLIGKQNETICNYEKKIEELGKELCELSKKVGGCEERTCVLQDEEPADNGSIDDTLEIGNNLSDAVPQPSVMHPTMVGRRCLTKCCGRSTSKHPSRSVKRRNMVLPSKSGSSKRPISFLSSSRSSISPLHHKKKDDDHDDDDDDEKSLEANTMNIIKTEPVPVEPITLNFKKPHKKRGRKPRTATWKDDFLHTDKPYFLPDYYVTTGPLANAEITIDVPAWRHLIFSSFYSMERTENLDDFVFQKRHQKFETEEMRRKKRDLQQQKLEMSAIEKLRRRKQCRFPQYSRGKTKDCRGKLRKKSISLYPNPNDIEYIEVTDSLPVIAFGHLIPVFQPSEFSLPWSIADPVDTAESPGRCKVIRTSLCGQKVT